jgi:hypothetical protein
VVERRYPPSPPPGRRLHAVRRPLTQSIAAHDLCGGYAVAHPGAMTDSVFGAACCLAIDDALAGPLLSSWEAGQSTLRPLAESMIIS